ncbi:hypothetical protein [Streptomyces chartreusis]|uniref:hypothetical protein n=1 Tax=Streptomyces chartreusis TaxID=1969 RepID=UPI00380C73AB
MEEFVQEDGVVGLAEFLGGLGVVGWVCGVEVEVELVASGGCVGGGEFDGFGVVGVGEVDVDVELVAGAGQE